MKIYLSNWESFYYIFLTGDYNFKLFLKFPQIIKRTKNFMATLSRLKEVSKELIVDTTLSDNDLETIDLDSYAYKLTALNALRDDEFKIASRDNACDIPITNNYRKDVHIRDGFDLLDMNAIVPTSQVNIPMEYRSLHGVLYGGATFNRKRVLKYSGGNLIDCGNTLGLITPSENLGRNLHEIEKYFAFIEGK